MNVEVEVALLKRRVEVMEMQDMHSKGFVSDKKYIEFMLEEKPLDLDYSLKTSKVPPPPVL